MKYIRIQEYQNCIWNIQIIKPQKSKENIKSEYILKYRISWVEMLPLYPQCVPKQTCCYICRPTLRRLMQVIFRIMLAPFYVGENLIGAYLNRLTQ